MTSGCFAPSSVSDNRQDVGHSWLLRDRHKALWSIDTEMWCENVAYPVLLARQRIRAHASVDDEVRGCAWMTSLAEADDDGVRASAWTGNTVCGEHALRHDSLPLPARVAIQ